MNSRYLTEDLFHELMAFLSFERLNTRWKEGGKMAYWLFQKKSIRPRQESSDKRAKFQTKIALRQGDRNNFAILL